MVEYRRLCHRHGDSAVYSKSNVTKENNMGEIYGGSIQEAIAALFSGSDDNYGDPVD
jgi:hypothetical protein